MGDRTIPMKFGPDWLLRNMSREPTGTGGSGAQSAPPAIRPATSSATASSNTSTPSKIQLANYRYGREEMLALYDPQSAEAPVELKTIEPLYQSSGKSPYALNSNLEEEARDSGGIRSSPQAGGMSADRFGPGRGRGYNNNPSNLNRGNSVIEGRGRARLFPRPTSSGSDPFRAPSWHNGAQRSYPVAPDDDPNFSRGLWNNGTGVNPPGIRPTTEQAEWANKMAYRKPRQNHTNWRQQQNRDEGEEWRSDSARRGHDKWDREWPERNPQEKGWSANRRHWGGDADELPEWAVENTEACGGTFDASGAFHGYSNDDSNVPKTPDTSFALARSQTHGSFAQDIKQFAKRRFDAIEVKFKKPTDESASGDPGNPPSASNEGANANSGETQEIPKIENIRNKLVSHEKLEKETEMQKVASALPVARDESKLAFIKARSTSAQSNKLLHQTAERESTSEQGTYKSVMMATNNNNLRQQHQNIGAPKPNCPVPPHFQMVLDARNKMESDYQEQKQKETKLVEDMLDMQLTDEIQAQLVNATTQSAGIPISVNSFSNQRPSSGMQIRMNNQLMTPVMGMTQQQVPISQAQSTPETTMTQPIGISNSVLNASLGLSAGTGSNMNMPMNKMPPPNPNSGMLSSNLQGLGTGNMQNNMIQNRMQLPGMPATSFQNAMPGNMQGLQPSMQTNNMNNNNMQSTSGMPNYQIHSFFMGAPNNMQNPGEMGNQGQQNMYPMHGHGLQQSASQGSFTPASLYGNIMQPPPAVLHPNIPLADLWYYEDPNKTIQGPFTSKEMYGWYHAGFFTSDLMVRRACESGFMPLASYGIMPFGSTDMMPPQFNMARARFDIDMRQQENMMNAHQVGLGPEVESLWSMRDPSADEMWFLPPSAVPPRDQVKKMINDLSVFFWDQPTGATNSVPETIKDMKTEDEILAQMRASQSESAAHNLTFTCESAAHNLTYTCETPAHNLTFICDAAVSPEEAFTAGTNIAPNLEELQKLIGSDIHRNHTPPAQDLSAATGGFPLRTHDDVDQKLSIKADLVPEVNVKQQPTVKTAEAKPSKQPAKVEDKPKIKETVPKTKPKKVREDKKEEFSESKKEELKILEKRSDEPSAPKNKREDKANKKDLEKEKKEWLKDGFTIVKGAEKKDSKKKEKEEARAAEEAEKKRKEEEKRALEAEKNKAPEPVTRRQQLEQGQRQSQTQEQPKRAPWSAQSAQTGRDGLALSDIQRLEKEKKLEQMKEQQQMMQVIAQQHAVAAQREQHETQIGQLGWAKKKQANFPPGQTLAEIQTEARKQAAAMVAASLSAAAREEKQSTPPPVNVTPWGTINGAGFWDCPPPTTSGTERASDSFSFMGPSTTTALKSKKKVTVVVPLKKEPSAPKKEISLSADFDTWCNHVLSNWKDAANIDIPTFVAFLRDIESPYEVKDYVKCYLGDTKEANDFARQFLERRSRMLRVGMVTPSDDLCSPAVALTPRTNSGSDYTEVKSKGNKKPKKNKMLKVDARILGFSVTASEDRINVGDIDTA